MPLDMPKAVPTAALLNEPVICCCPRGRIEFSHDAHESLRMDMVLGPLEIGFFVEHYLPICPFLLHLAQEIIVRFRSNTMCDASHGWLTGSNNSLGDRE